MSKFESTSYDHPVTILKHNEFVATPVLVDKTGVIVNDDGKYIVKAGTIVGGNTKAVLENPTEPVVEKNDPAVAAAAELVIDETPDAEVSILVTAVKPGTSGNDLKVQLKDPAAANSPLSVEIDEETIIVNLETDGTAAVAAKKDFDNASPDANSKVTITAKEAGVAGNSIKVQFVDPSSDPADLAVNISGDTIVVSLATNESGTITSTAKNVADAINAHLIAKQLVTATYSGNGTTVVEAHAGAALEGGADEIAGDIVSTVAEVVDAINGHFDVAKLIEAEAIGEDSGLAIAVAATPLAGGDDGSGYEAEGVLLYDVDVTHGDAPGAMIVWGFIDKSKLDEDPCEDAVEALKGRIVFFDV
ncbi:MAG: hypothetical protein QM445_05040 [Thermotogota bacterium]|nr:hypothetical protein [Thermotogota bacterium]